MTAVAHDARIGAGRPLGPRPGPRLRLAPVPSPQPCVDAPLADLTGEEERLAYQAYLGDLHPTHAARLAAVTNEIDRRWHVALG